MLQIWCQIHLKFSTVPLLSDPPEYDDVAGGGVLRAEDPGAVVPRVGHRELVLVHVHGAPRGHLRLAQLEEVSLDIECCGNGGRNRY